MIRRFAWGNAVVMAILASAQHFAVIDAQYRTPQHIFVAMTGFTKLTAIDMRRRFTACGFSIVTVDAGLSADLNVRAAARQIPGRRIVALRAIAGTGYMRRVFSTRFFAVMATDTSADHHAMIHMSTRNKACRGMAGVTRSLGGNMLR